MSWTLTALRYATRPTTREEVFYRYALYGEPDGPQEMAYFLWVLRDGERTIVVDSGFSARGGERRGRRHLVAPLDALARVGVEPGAVDAVVVTHLHYDHTGHLDAFGAAPLLVPRTELEFWAGPWARRAQLAAHVEPDEIDALASARVEPMGPRHEVAPGVVAVEVGGHSPGQVILDVEGAAGPIVLASDAIHFYEELERDRACAILVDLPAVYAAYDALREREAAGARVVAGHDPLVMERFPRLDGDLGVEIT